MARLERDLQNLQQILKQATDPSATEAKRHQMQQQFSEALEQLKNGKMKPDQDLLEKLNKAAQDAMGDLTEKGPTTSGAAQSEGIGGDRVWKDALDPSEQKSLKRFFE